MLRSTSKRIAEKANITRVSVFGVLYALCLCFILFNALEISVHTQKFRIIELEPQWHPEEIKAWTGSSMLYMARKYLEHMMWADMINIVVYAFFFSYLISWLYKQVRIDHPAMRLNLVPYVMAAFDLAENIFIFGVMYSSDDKKELVYAQLANAAILLKLAAGMICVASIAYGAYLFLKRKRSFSA